MAEGGKKLETEDESPPPYSSTHPIGTCGYNIYPGMPEDKTNSCKKPSTPSVICDEKIPLKGDSVLIAQVIKAADLAARRHRNQRRGDPNQTPYVNHPIGVAYILTNEAKITDVATIVAAILHDVVEDTKTTFEEIQEQFGDEVCRLVKECTVDKKCSKDERRKQKIELAPHLTRKAIQAKMIELANQLYNARDVERVNPVGWNSHKKKDFFKWTKEYVAKLKGSNDALEAALDDVINKNLN
ncbi:hypothetical protein AB6A40_003790 [Gnathostoma spinigerum]|uniref:HD domain-containing protein n=1 Tax=Gnathostoma spinigerum TaxID=75299 RepID=A0ABD6EI68_9BILA